MQREQHDPCEQSTRRAVVIGHEWDTQHVRAAARNMTARKGQRSAHEPAGRGGHDGCCARRMVPRRAKEPHAVGMSRACSVRQSLSRAAARLTSSVVSTHGSSAEGMGHHCWSLVARRLEAWKTSILRL